MSVVIVGGGPVGLGLAIELGQRGIACTVVERYRAPSPIPRGQNLTQRTAEHFHSWGCEPALRAARTIPPSYGIGGLTSYGKLLSDYHYDWMQRERVRPYYFTDNERLPQYATEAVLRRRADEIEAVTTLYGWSFERLERGEEGVSVTIAEREGPGRRTLEASYVVGCDGSRSGVREQAGISQTTDDHDRLMVLLVFRSTELHELLARYPGKSFYSVLHPDHDGYWMFFGRVDLGSTWFFHAPVPPGTTRDNYDFRGLLHRAVGEEFAVEFEHIGFWDLRIASADSYAAGRAFIAGDAAHSHPPYGGYGINTGFEDARNLGWKLAATLQGWGGPALLDSYTAERRPVFQSTARDFIARGIETDRDFLRAYDPERDLAAFERAWAARSTGAVAEVGAFEPNYEGSPIVFGGGAPSAVGRHEFTARPGHHLAPANLASGAPIHEALGEGFTLLALGAEEGAVRAFAEAAAARSIPLTVISDDGSGETARYGWPLVLVRPDQFVAWCGETGDPGGILDRATGRA